jgi:hypothetical protein
MLPGMLGAGRVKNQIGMRILGPFPRLTLMRPLFVKRPTAPESGFAHFFRRVPAGGVSSRSRGLPEFPSAGAPRGGGPTPVWRCAHPVRDDGRAAWRFVSAPEPYVWPRLPSSSRRLAACRGLARACRARGRGRPRHRRRPAPCVQAPARGAPPSRGLRAQGPRRALACPEAARAAARRLTAGASLGGPVRRRAPPRCARRSGGTSVVVAFPTASRPLGSAEGEASIIINRLQPTPYSVRSYVAPASSGG